MTTTTPDERWLAALLPYVRDQLPPAPARVLEIGCGPLGGFVPGLFAKGHHAVGVDPEAPEGPSYHQVDYEQHVRQPMDAIVACTSLHHVANLDEVLDRVASALTPGGTFLVIEWAYERFDEPTARWCFDRLPPPDPEQGWLHRHREAWETSGQSWEFYLKGWADHEALHRGDTILEGLHARFETRVLERTPYFFSDLHSTTEEAEQAAIDSGRIQPTGIRYVGQRGST